jgi:tRNA (uracil-5-)-methyltransferase TRM9
MGNVPVAAAGGESSAPAAPTAPPEEGTETASGAKDNDPVFKRYYHLYRKGELEEDVLAAGGVVITSGYERDNWWAVAANGASS